MKRFGVAIAIVMASNTAVGAEDIDVPFSFGVLTTDALIGNTLPSDVIPFERNNGLQVSSRSNGMKLMIGEWHWRYSSRQRGDEPEVLKITLAQEGDVKGFRKSLIRDRHQWELYRHKIKSLDSLLDLSCANRWSAFDMTVGDFAHWDSYSDKMRSHARNEKTSHNRKSITMDLVKKRQSFFYECRLAMKDNDLLTVRSLSEGDDGKEVTTDVAIGSTMLAGRLSGWHLRDKAIVNNTFYKGHYGLDLQSISDLRIGETHLIDIINDHQILIYDFRQGGHNNFVLYDKLSQPVLEV